MAGWNVGDIAEDLVRLWRPVRALFEDQTLYFDELRHKAGLYGESVREEVAFSMGQSPSKIPSNQKAYNRFMKHTHKVWNGIQLRERERAGVINATTITSAVGEYGQKLWQLAKSPSPDAGG